MYTLSTGGVSVRTNGVDLVDDVCHSVECGAGEPELQAGLVLASVVLTIGLVATFRYIAEAHSLLDRERERTAAERDAFAAFEREVSGIETTQSVPTAGTAVAVTAGPTDHQLDQVRNAYRETVMAVPHYETEYDEPIQANMSAELGQEVTAAVFDGSRFTHQLKHGLLSQATEACRRRRKLLETLDRETRRLTDASEDLRDIETTLDAETPDSIEDCTFTDLSERWDGLGDAEDRCRDLLEDYATPHTSTPEDQPEFREYVYQSMPTEYPVLSDGTRLLDRITDSRHRLLHALTRRA
jgi:hypothetical protein